MALTQRKNVGYGQNQPLVDVFPTPIVAQRAPTNNDRAEPGTIWVNTVTDESFILASTKANVSTWLHSAGSQTDGAVSPAAAVTIDAFSGVAEFVGFTTAAAAVEVFTINNNLLTIESNLLVTVMNDGANDAQMTLTRVEPLAGAVEITVTNNGAAALNGDVIVVFQVVQ